MARQISTNKLTFLGMLLRHSPAELSWLNLDWNEEFLEGKTLFECLLMYGNDNTHQYLIESKDVSVDAMDGLGLYWISNLLDLIIARDKSDFFATFPNDTDSLETKEAKRIKVIKGILKSIEERDYVSIFENTPPNARIFNGLFDNIKIKVYRNSSPPASDSEIDRYFSLYLDLIKIPFSGALAEHYPVDNIISFLPANIYSSTGRWGSHTQAVLSEHGFADFFKVINIIKDKDIFFNQNAIKIIASVFVSLEPGSPERNKIHDFLVSILKKQASSKDNIDCRTYLNLMEFCNSRYYKISSDFYDLLYMFPNAREVVIDLLKKEDRVFITKDKVISKYHSHFGKISPILENILNESILNGDDELSRIIFKFIANKDPQLKLPFLNKIYNSNKFIDKDLLNKFFIPPPIDIVSLCKEHSKDNSLILHHLFIDVYGPPSEKDSNIDKKTRLAALNGARDLIYKLSQAMDHASLIKFSVNFFDYAVDSKNPDQTIVLSDGTPMKLINVKMADVEKFILDFSVPNNNIPNRFKL